jgi:sulfur carrier protein ThiS
MAGNRKTLPAMPPANGVIDVVWCPNPLRPVADRQVKRVVLTGTDTVSSVVRRLGLQGTSVVATLNTCAVPRKRWGRKRVRQGDALVLLQRARGIEMSTVAAKIIMDFAWYEIAAAAVLAFLTSDIGIAIALSLLSNSLAKRGRNQQKEPGAAVAVYSIEGGANEARLYGPLPLVLGEHRVFPDYACRPFAEYVPDATTTHRVINSTPEYEDQTPPTWSYTEVFNPGPETWDVTPAAPWTQLSGDGTNFVFGDNQDRTYTGPAGEVTVPHTFVVKHTGGDAAGDRITDWESYVLADPGLTPDPANWRALGIDLPVIVAYGYLVTDHTEQLTSVFNFGLGDLAHSDYRVGSTPLANFNAWQTDASVVPGGDPSRTALTGYASPGYTGTDYPDDVVIIEGGKLEQRAGVLNSGWVERSGRPGRYVQIDVAGRLFSQVNGGVEVLSCNVEAEYRAAGSGVWTPMAFSPATLSNGSTNIHRRTFSQSFAFDVDAVRVRRSTPEPTDARDVSELEFTRVKIFKPQAALYPAQRRLGLIIKASGQLNGRIDRFSAFVKAKHWAWDSGAAWTPGVYPAAGAGAWVWQETVNPAWLFLYYARGGFLNTGSPTGWLDRPDPSNGERLFGAGLTNDRIDYAAIVAWGQWCQANGLTCRMVVDEQRSAGDVLDQIAGAGRGSKSWASGKLSVVWEAAGQPVVAAFGMSNIVAGSFNVGYDTDTTVHEIALQYTRSDADYQPDTVYAQVPGVGQVVSQRAEQAVYSMPQAQAQRLVNLLAASRYYHRRRITWESHLEALSVQRGDIVHLAHDLTQWAFSGRLLRLVVAGGAVTQVQLSCQVENPGGAGAFYLWVRQPGGTYMSIECTPPAARTDVVDVVGVWSTAHAPGQLGGATDPANPASDFPDTMPEDWMFLAGPTATPGKRVRITGMEPVNGRRVRITARDEYEAYYPLEYGLGGAPAPASGERLVARAFNLTIDPAPAGGHRLSWELENAHGADVTVSVDGGAPTQVPTQGVLSVLGTEVLLPAYPAGTELTIALLPIAAGVPVAVQGDSLTVEV